MQRAMKASVLTLLCSVAPQQALAALARRAASTYLRSLRATTFEDIRDEEVDLTYMLPAPHKDFPVSVMTYRDLSNDTTISKSLQTLGEWEGFVIKRLCDEWEKHPSAHSWTFVDVGANIGSWMIPMASCAGRHGGKVVGVEAMPNNARFLRAGMKYNNLKNVHLYEYAVGNSSIPDEVNMIWNYGNQGKGQVVPRALRRKGEVTIKRPTTTLDMIQRNEGAFMKPIFAMKVDVEGFERQAVQGGELLMRNPPCILYIEIKQDRTLQQWLPEKFGYKCNGDGGPKGYYGPHIKERHLDIWCQQRNFNQCVRGL